MWQLTWLNYIFLEQTARYSKTTHRSPGCNPSIPSGFITAEVEPSSPSQGLPMIVEIDHPGDDAMDCASHWPKAAKIKQRYISLAQTFSGIRDDLWGDFWKTPPFSRILIPQQKGHCWQSTSEKTRKLHRSSACKPEVGSQAQSNDKDLIPERCCLSGAEKEKLKTFHRKNTRVDTDHCLPLSARLVQ